MGRYVFVPLTDEILYERPDLINGPLRPYVAGRACYHWLSVEINPQDDLPPPPRNVKLRSFPIALPTLEKALRGPAHSL